MTPSGFRTPLAAAAAIAFTVFFVLIFVHARIERAVEWYAELVQLNVEAERRLKRDWAPAPAEGGVSPKPAAAERSAWAPAGGGGHPYANDLDLFGRASVFRLLWPRGSALGRDTLAD